MSAPLTLQEQGRAYLREIMKAPIKSNKYGAKKTVVDGITFDSMREAARYSELKLLEKGAIISRLELQPEFKFELNGKVIFKYIADFRYFEGQIRVVEDVKGVQTPLFRLKRKLIESQFNIKIVLVA
jgi:hypothetical protein